MVAVFTDDLLADVKRDAFLTTAQSNFTDAQLLSIGDDCLTRYMIPMLLSLREGFFRVYQDLPFVASQSDYALPTYAMYGKLESIQYLSSSGQLMPGQLTRIEVENLQDVLPTLGTGVPRFFTVNSSYITVYPAPTTAVGDSIRCYYDRRPGFMIETSDAAEVLSANPTTGVVTYTAAPPSTFTASSYQDFYRGQSPYQLLAQTQASALAGSTQTFPAATAALLSAGDWVCPKDQSVFVPIPEELVPFLSDMVINSLARTQQDSQLYQAQQAEITKQAKLTMTGVSNRLPGNPKRIRLNTPLVRNRSVPRYR